MHGVLPTWVQKTEMISEPKLLFSSRRLGFVFVLNDFMFTVCIKSLANEGQRTFWLMLMHTAVVKRFSKSSLDLSSLDVDTERAALLGY